MKTKPYILDLVALVAGAVLTVAFAPFNLFPLAIASPMALMVTWLNASPSRAYWRGLLFGIGFFGTGVHWIFISVHNFGNTSTFLASLITAGLIFILSVFIGLNGYFLNRYFPRTNTAKLVCAFPAIWVLMEWMRTWIFTGFPWLLVGYSQLNSPLRGFAPVLSVYGVSFATIASCGLMLCVIRHYRRGQVRLELLSAAGLLLIWVGAAVLNNVAWTSPTGKPIKVSLVQGNIAQELKWSAEQIQPTLDHYIELTRQHWDSEIIIWPESAIPIPLDSAENVIQELNEEATRHNTSLLVGIPMKDRDSDSYYNMVMGIGKAKGIYAKRHLVPFGEYIPLRSVFGKLLDLLKVPMSDFIPYLGHLNPIMADNLKIATFICYEIAYPELVRSEEPVDLILTVSNDAWFGHSIAQAQHLEIAQMRALEMGRPVLFGSNDGITAIIDNYGKIKARAPQYQAYVLTDTLQIAQGKTPWQVYGLDPVLMLILAFIIIALFKRKSNV